tara:strand:+ start:220 stop:399 length:180 start_codon:yes stop_codon:yes gene_type:complete
MKYKMSKKLKSFSAINDYHGLGKENANKLEAGESVELKNPPKALVDGGWLEPASNKEKK